MTSLVTLQRVTKGFGERPLFSELTLHVAEDERLGLIGPNGAGKTTLLRLLGGRDTPDAGERLAPRPLRTGWVEQAPDFPPEADRLERISRNTTMPAGSTPEMGSSRYRKRGSPSRACASASRCSMPRE